MDHDQMTLHQILLGMIEDKKDIADLENEVRRLEDQHGVETYAELLYILANIKIGPKHPPCGNPPVSTCIRYLKV